MSYLPGWKPLSGLLSVATFPTQRRWIFAGVIGLAVSSCWFFAYRYSPTVRAWVDASRDGQIIVSSPTVYTRQRLVNDRLKQVAWLEEQLKAADGYVMSSDKRPEFTMIDQVRGSTEGISIRGGFGVSAPKVAETESPAQSSANGPPADRSDQSGIRVAPTTASLFRAKNSFREELRAEMMETQLDDRHDIQGNTIYRLSFQASVLAGTRPDAVAGVAIKLSHCPNRKPASPSQDSSPEVSSCSELSAQRRETTQKLYENDYQRLYFDWLRHLQKAVTSSIDALTERIVTDKPLDPELRRLFSSFIIGRACEAMILEVPFDARVNESCSLDTITSDVDPKKANEITENSNAAKWLVGDYLERYLNWEGDDQNQFFQRFVADERDAYPKLVSIFEDASSLRDKAALRCSQKMSQDIDLVELASPRDIQTANTSNYLIDRIKLPCPYYDSPSQRLKAGIFLYKTLSGWVNRRDPLHGRGDILKTQEELIARTKDKKSRIFDLRSEARCMAADFLRARLNSFDRRAPVYEQIGYFMKADLTGRELSDCQLLVSPNQRLPTDALIYHLNKDSEVFSYTVTPKNLAENISTTAEVRDAFEMIAQHQFGKDEGGPVFAKALRAKSEELRAVLEHPLIVGFGSGRQPLQFIENRESDTRSSTIQTLELGWIVAPHVRPGGSLVQIDGQYPLTAVISVPSWWRSVELDIDTCWIPRDELADNLRSDHVLFCKAATEKPVWTVIQLPGAIAEVSRKLGFEVVEEPYITDPVLQHLTVGKPGHLILTGGRLWRSTAVTIGSQAASSITVLPNMEGIIADFKCVEPQIALATKDDPQPPPHQVPARVWTSEGVTESSPVSLDGEGSCRDESTTGQAN